MKGQTRVSVGYNVRKQNHRKFIYGIELHTLITTIILYEQNDHNSNYLYIKAIYMRSSVIHNQFNHFKLIRVEKEPKN